MISYFEKYRTELEDLCKTHHVLRLYAFGSVLTRRFKKGSDVDLIVAFDNNVKVSFLKNFFGLVNDLEHLFGRKVDLMEEKPIRNPVLREEIEKTKRLIYHGKKSEEMAV